MTPEQLDEIEKRASLATAEPWEGSGIMGSVTTPDGCMFFDWDAPQSKEEDTIRFVKHARTDVPALVAEVRRLRAAMLEAYRHIDYCGECDRDNDPCDTDRADRILKEALK